jgi:hypothetical protein
MKISSLKSMPSYNKEEICPRFSKLQTFEQLLPLQKIFIEKWGL